MARTKAFPRREPDYVLVVKAVIAYIIANLARLGLTAAQQTALTNALNTFLTDYGKTSVKATRTQQDTATKNASKAVLTNLIRTTLSGVADDKLTPADRINLNILEPATRTPSTPPTTKPVLQLDGNSRLLQTASFSDEAANGKRGNPPGVRACQLFVALIPVGAPVPTDPKAYRYLATDTSTPYVATFEAADAGKIACYIGRWENERGQTGPWSDPVSAAIKP